ncbi:hypothetical protein AOLI_G00173730 [Acnodon oligacanthus]
MTCSLATALGFDLDFGAENGSCGRCSEVMPQTRRKTVSGKRSTKKQRTGPVEIEDREMSNEEPDKDLDMDPVLLPETSDEGKKIQKM